MRAETFQSMSRMSSPAMYCRTSEKAIPRPLKTEWYCPAIRSRTRRSVTISILRMRLRSSRGNMTPRTTDFSEALLRHFDPLEQLAHHRLGRHLLGLRFVGQDNPVPEDVDADGLDVLGGDVAAVAQEGVRARRQVQVDRRARAGAEGDEVRQIVQPVGFRLARGVHDVDDVVADLLVDVDLLHDR